MPPYRMLGLALLLAWMPVAAGAAVPASVTSLRELIALDEETAAREIPVRVDAVVVFHDLTRATYFAHDGTASCRVVIPRKLAEGIALLDRIELSGVSRKGGFLTDMIAKDLRVLGRAEPPAPRVLAGEEIFANDACAQWVSVEGRIKGTHATDGGLALELMVQGWTIPAVLPGDVKTATPPWHLLQRRVRVTGIAGTFFNQERQMTGRYLHVPGMEFFEVVPESEPGSRAEETTTTGLLRPHTDAQQRVRVRGVVTAVRPGEGLVLRDDNASLRVRTAQPLDLRPGVRVEAEGIPALEPFRPALRAVEVRVLGDGPPPAPLPFRPQGPRRTREHNELVTLEARVVALERESASLRIQCQSGKKIFEAQLDPLPRGVEFPGLVPDARVRLTGLCQLQTSRFLFLPEYVDDFRLLLRDAADLAVIDRPSWWTAERLALAAGALLVFGAIVAAWALLLRWRVAAQTAIIRDKIARETLLEERHRIARDWHDTMEQQLMGVSMLVEDATARLAADRAPSGAAERLTLAQRMIRHCREESRASIRDLRSVALETGDFRAACEELLAPLARAAGAEFRVTVLGDGRRLPRHGEHQLLRIAQEAVANAAKHAAAKTIAVEAAYRKDGITLTISDNGRGFDPGAIQEDEVHLGLATMRERARHLGAALELDSRPGQGTRVRVSWTVEPEGKSSA